VAAASKGNVIFSMVKVGVVAVVETHSSVTTMASNIVVKARSAIMVARNRFGVKSKILVVVVVVSNTVVVVAATNTVAAVAIKVRIRRRKRVRSRMMIIQTPSLPRPYLSKNELRGLGILGEEKDYRQTTLSQ